MILKKCKKDLNNKCIYFKNKNNTFIPPEIKEEFIEFKKKFKKPSDFKKFIYPFINRVSSNIYDRINYYNNITKYFKFKNFSDKCLRYYKTSNNNKPIYRVGNSLILKNRIGSDSVNGIVFLTTFRNSNLKLFKFASKIVVYNHKVKKELKILYALSNLVRSNKCPHFPILYYILSCNNFTSFDNSSYVKSINNNTNNYNVKNLDKYPNVIRKNIHSRFSLTLNELANGDLKMFINDYNYSSDLHLNAFAQIIFSLFFFYYHIKAYHNDAHWGNFLFHKIKPKGYFHYKFLNTNYYLKNLGFLWIIWDYELSIFFNDITSSTDITPSIDVYRIIHAFIPENLGGWVPDNKYKINHTHSNTLIEIKKNFKNINNLNSLLNYLLNTLINLKVIQKNKPKKNLIINKIPFIIPSLS
jgi:hypothetical protein